MSDLLKQAGALVSFLGALMPDFCDVILFDARSAGFPVLEQSNWMSGNVRLIRKEVKQCVKDTKAVTTGYMVKKCICNNEMELYSLSVFFLKEKDKVVGVLAISSDCTPLLKAYASLANMLPIMTEETEVQDDYSGELETISKLSDITDVVEKFTDGIRRISPQERGEIILDLYDAGAFCLKGAVSKVAEDLKMSEQSVYRYLTKIKKMRK